jgi:hypothetical protein
MKNTAKAKYKLERKERSLQEQLRALIAKRDKVDATIAEIKSQLADLQYAPVLYELKPDNHVYCGKICYPSMHAAGVAKRTINADLKEKGVDPLQRAYFCEQCEAWHLTTN